MSLFVRQVPSQSDHAPISMDQTMGIEPMSGAYQAPVLPVTPRLHLGLVTGVEPATHRLQGDCSAVEPHQHDWSRG